MTWALVPAAGSGRRFGGEIPKQYQYAAGKPLIAHTLDALLSHPHIAGVVVALAQDDPHWPGWSTLHGKPVLTCVGGCERADSVLAALHALPEHLTDETLVLEGKDKAYIKAAGLGRLFVPFDESGKPLDLRTARHVATISAFVEMLDLFDETTGVVIDGIPTYDAILKKGVGSYLTPLPN